MTVSSSPSSQSWFQVFLSTLRDTGAVLGAVLVLQALIWPVSARESLLFVFWSTALGPWGRVGVALLAGVGLVLGAFAGSRRTTGLVWGLLAPGMGLALWDAVQLWRAALAGSITLENIAWMPGSLMLALVLMLCGLAMSLQDVRAWPWTQGWLRGLLRVSGVGLLGGLLVFHHVMTVGETNYQRHADTAVILGAAVWSGGRPSSILVERVMTGVRLFKEGRVTGLLMTGGTGANGYSEPQVMRDLAVSHGVPARVITLDEVGVNTAASVRTLKRFRSRGELGRLLVVSHDHHTARIRLACHRLELRCYTVPAYEPWRIPKEPYYIFRETVAWVVYAMTFRSQG